MRQNIAAIAERPKKVNTIPEMLDIEDILKVIAASRKVKNYGGLVIEFIFKTGMRHSEALKTTWDRIDFDKGTVRVGQSKNESSSNRIILLDKELLDLLKLHQKEQQSNVDTEDLKKKFNPMGYVFCNSAGNLQNRSNVWRDIWKPLRKSLGIDEKMTVHDLRHNCASYLLQDPETSIPVVSAWLGHKTPKTTMEIYAHILPNDLELGRNAMSKLSINRG